MQFFPMVVLFLVVWLFVTAFRIANEYERGVILRLGRFHSVKGPGWFLAIPFNIDKVYKVDLRTVTWDVPVQEVITRDNVPCKVNAVVYFSVIDPERAVLKVQDFRLATSQIAQTSLRSVLGQADFDDLLSKREAINAKLQQIIDLQTDPWGIKVSIVEVKDVQVPENMQRAMAHQAEAERDRRAKVIAAEGEFQAAQKLADAARIISSEPAALQLRYFQTAKEISSEKNSTLVFPVPLDFMKLVNAFVEKAKA